MWCKWRKEMGNEQPETQAQVSLSPCARGPVSWYMSISFSKQKPKTAKIQHRRSVERDDYNHHPFLKRDFLCKKWLFYGNALNPCNHANPFLLLWRRCQYCDWGHFWWYQQKQLNKSKAVLLVQIYIWIDTVTVLGQLHLFFMAKRHWGTRLWQMPGYRYFTVHPPSWHFHQIMLLLQWANYICAPFAG